MRRAPCYFIGYVAGAFAIILVLVSAAVAQQPNGRRLLDLTHPFDETTIYWPTEDGFKLLREAAGITEQGY